ncbi:MAG: hypothetical protein K0R65_616 [Crocinitomicaceae bacterium]|jgi:hypothetical protein|nr:hypothetical protein [Crocinitomicaceae bacterium]
MMTETTSGSVLEKISSLDFFKTLNMEALIRRYELSAQLRIAAATPPAATPPQPQVGPVISSIPAEGIVINTPGSYEFANDITWAPTSPGAAISIQADNVTLDLKGFTLQANNLDVYQQFKGIELLNGTTNTVQNGTISGMTYYGLHADSINTLQISGLTVTNMSYSDIQTAAATPCGILVDKTEGFTITGCQVSNMNVLSASCAGIQALESVNGTLSGCAISNLQNQDGAVQGYSYLLSAGVQTTNCTASAFQSFYKGLTKTTGHTVLGFIPIFCVDLIFDSCSSTTMTGCCDDCHGMSVFLNAYVSVTNFTATGVTDGVTPRNTGAKATGLEVYGCNITITNCSVENIMAIVPQDLQSAGFSAWGQTITFDGCTATNVQVVDAQRNPDTKLGYGTGFGWAPDPRPEFSGQAADQVTYNNCTSNNCQLGFDTWYHTNSTWTGITTPGCPISILVQPDGTQRTLSMDKCSESPSGQEMSVTLSNIAANNTYPSREN